MAVIRTEKNGNYTTMSNFHLKDRNLSLKAKGLLSLVLSLPDEWHLSVEGTARICLEGRDAVQAGFSELEKNGYLIRRQLRTPDGKLSGVEYVIYERPQAVKGKDPREMEKPGAGRPSAEKPLTEKPSAEKPLTGKPSAEKPSAEKPLTGKPSAEKPSTEKPYTEKPYAGYPDTGNPSAEKPSTENPQQLITNRSSTKISNTKREGSSPTGLGPYQNVFLTETEMEQLREEFPADHEERIDRLSLYMASTGKHYKNHLATIRKWADDDRSRRQTRADPKELPYSPERYRFREGESL